MTTGQAFFLATLVALLFAILILLGTQISEFRGIRTDAPITPELKIYINNGVADTTYIYRRIQDK